MRLVSFLPLILFSSQSLATGWKFVGPDSLHWRSVVQMDVSFKPGRLPYIGAGTLQGVTIELGGGWRYVLRDLYGWFPPPEVLMYRALYFSPWNDSAAFVGFNLHYVSEPGSMGVHVPDIYRLQWGSLLGQIGGGYVGYNPSLSFEFSPHRPMHVYSWMIDYYRSTNGGLSWTSQTPLPCYGTLFLSLDQQKDSILYTGAPSATQTGLYRSTNDGTTWAFIRALPITGNPFLSQRPADFLARGDTLVLATNRFPNAADSTCGISVSTDGGATWGSVLPNTNVQRLSRDPTVSGVVYAAAQGGIFRSLNYGISWHLYTDSLPSVNLVDIRKDPYSDTLYVAMRDSGIYKVYDVSVAVPEDHGQPQGFQLYHNYPNPFNSRTSIGFRIQDAGFTSLKVYDVLGREAATLVNEVKSPGTYQVTWNAAGVASGVYFYRLAAGGLVETKRMLLIK